MGAEKWQQPAPAVRATGQNGSAAANVQKFFISSFPLDKATLLEAEDAALRFVQGPWRTPAAIVPAAIPANVSPTPVPAPAPAAVASPAKAPSEASDPAPAEIPEPPAPVADPVEQPPTPAPAPAATAPATGVAAPTAAVAETAAPAPAPSEAADAFWQRKTWAQRVSPVQEVPMPLNRLESPPLPEDGKTRKASIIEYLVLLAAQKSAAAENIPIPAEGLPEAQMFQPEDITKFERFAQNGTVNNSRVKYNRRGMRNDANNCYVNVCIQSLLSVGALMQILSHCATCYNRPFYACLVRLCKEFHAGRKTEDAFNILAMPNVREIISTWQQLGAQQDAGEFLFYMLDCMHEECKWKVITPPSKDPGGQDDGTGPPPKAEDWMNRRLDHGADVRSSGAQEDSPIARIFGGMIRSTVRARSARSDSVSLEPFNHLILDISQPGVESVNAALEAYCAPEAVGEGKTKRLQFKVVPKVLILNLKRFSYNRDTFLPQKIKKAVKYEETFVFDRNWLVDDIEPQEYQLTAVICHIGDSVHGGHYNAAVRYNTDWYMYDDALVRQMEIREVTAQQFTAYLLVYQCNGKIDIRP